MKVKGLMKIFLSKSKKYKFLAFTLAEILIVVGIIGVIAESTIPSLVSDFQDKVVAVQLKKDFSTITQAFNAIRAEEGELQDWCPDGDQVALTACVGELFSKHLKVLKNCGTGDGEGCIPTVGYKLLFDNGSYDDTLNFDGSYKMQLVDGSTIIIMAGSDVDPGEIVEMGISVDVNGPKDPNRYGYDLFYFFTYSPNYQPEQIGNHWPRMLTPNSTFRTGGLASTGCDNTGGWGAACTSWVIYNGNLDYKYVNDLNWETKTHK